MKQLLLTCSLLAIFTTTHAQAVDTLEEDFSSFDSTELPQKGWNTNSVSGTLTRIELNGNKGIRSYCFSGPSTFYVITPELTAIDGIKSLKFKMFGYGEVQVGVTSDPDMTKITQNYQAVSRTQPIASGNWNDYSINIKASDAKYIVFKITPGMLHGVVRLDDVYYKDHHLSVSDISQRPTPLFVLDHHSLLFRDNHINSVRIFSANGSLVATEKVTQNRVNIAKLGTGVYFMTMEDNNGNLTTSKFIKK